jgi:hypothetical protein
MNRTFPNIPKKTLRYIFVFAAMVLVLLSSCPVKSSLRTLAGFPVKTEQGVTKGNHTFFASERCVNTPTTETSVSQTVSADTNNLLPVVLFTAAFLFLPGYALCREQSRTLYGNIRIPGTLPIFLQHRKLII